PIRLKVQPVVHLETLFCINGRVLHVPQRAKDCKTSGSRLRSTQTRPPPKKQILDLNKGEEEGVLWRSLTGSCDHGRLEKLRPRSQFPLLSRVCELKLLPVSDNGPRWIYSEENKYLNTLRLCKFSNLEIMEGSEIFIFGACPL
ncbi:hypothetical protein ILYODFUR_019015, partial [Ilyodon furcidens]